MHGLYGEYDVVSLCVWDESGGDRSLVEEMMTDDQWGEVFTFVTRV